MDKLHKVIAGSESHSKTAVQPVLTSWKCRSEFKDPDWNS